MNLNLSAPPPENPTGQGNLLAKQPELAPSELQDNMTKIRQELNKGGQFPTAIFHGPQERYDKNLVNLEFGSPAPGITTINVTAKEGSKAFIVFDGKKVTVKGDLSVATQVAERLALLADLNAVYKRPVNTPETSQVSKGGDTRLTREQWVDYRRIQNFSQKIPRNENVPAGGSYPTASVELNGRTYFVRESRYRSGDTKIDITGKANGGSFVFEHYRLGGSSASGEGLSEVDASKILNLAANQMEKDYLPNKPRPK